VIYAGQEILDIKKKDPQAELLYTIDWSPWLAGATIAVSTWSAAAGITVMGGANAPTNTTTLARVWLSGGTAGQDYRVTNHIETSGSPALKDERSFLVRVIER
jgi:hypothetical protein